ncbi:hypothetical protein LINPERHAP1_LOCUS33908 [Linum perenne]
MAVKNIVINTTITMMIMMGLITTVIADLDHPAKCTGKKMSDDYTKKVKILVQKLQYGAANDPTLRAAGTEYSVTGQASCGYRKEDSSNCLAWGVVKLGNGCNGTKYGSYAAIATIIGIASTGIDGHICEEHTRLTPTSRLHQGTEHEDHLGPPTLRLQSTDSYLLLSD